MISLAKRAETAEAERDELRNIVRQVYRYMVWHVGQEALRLIKITADCPLTEEEQKQLGRDLALHGCSAVLAELIIKPKP